MSDYTDYYQKIETRLIEAEGELSNKNQRIKELEELLSVANGAIIASEQSSSETFFEWRRNFKSLLNSYKEKYER